MGWECNGHSVCLIVERIILQLQSGHVHGGPLRRNSEKICAAGKERKRERFQSMCACRDACVFAEMRANPADPQLECFCCTIKWC